MQRYIRPLVLGSIFFFAFQAQAAGELKEIFPLTPQTWTIKSVKVGGGSFWRGYKRHTVDFDASKLSGAWDRRGMDGIESSEDSLELNKQEASAILSSFRKLKKTVLKTRCAIISDGDENSISVHYQNDKGGEEELYVVTESAADYVCGDLYVTDESYQQLADKLENMLPEPEEATKSAAQQNIN